MANSELAISSVSQHQPSTENSEKHDTISPSTTEPSAARFACYRCGFSGCYDNRGRLPAFCRSVHCVESSAYVVYDPLVAVKRDRRPVLLGADCSACRRPVCCSSECSVFYVRTFCVECAGDGSRIELPRQITDRLGK